MNDTGDTLNFSVRLSAPSGGRLLTATDWKRVAFRLAKAAQGRSKWRTAIVFADDVSVTIEEDRAPKFHVHS